MSIKKKICFYLHKWNISEKERELRRVYRQRGIRGMRKRDMTFIPPVKGVITVTA